MGGANPPSQGDLGAVGLGLVQDCGDTWKEAARGRLIVSLSLQRHTASLVCQDILAVILDLRRTPAGVSALRGTTRPGVFAGAMTGQRLRELAHETPLLRQQILQQHSRHDASRSRMRRHSPIRASDPLGRVQQQRVMP